MSNANRARFPYRRRRRGLRWQSEASSPLRSAGADVLRVANGSLIEVIHRAVLALQTDKPVAVKLAESLSVRWDGEDVKARPSLASDDVVKLSQSGPAQVVCYHCAEVRIKLNSSGNAILCSQFAVKPDKMRPSLNPFAI